VFGDISKAKRIVFVCDASWTMRNLFGSLKETLNRLIGGLKDGQQAFDVVFFQGDKVLSINPKGLTAASPDSKRAASMLLESVTIDGEANPIPALRHAFSLHPDLIVFQFDGHLPDDESYEKAVKEIRKLNVGPKVQVYGVRSNSDGQSDKWMMRTIARENNGTYTLWIVPGLEFRATRRGGPID
jgi:hypothetical protein